MDSVIVRPDVMLVQEEPRGPSILVEIPVTAAVQQINIPDVQQLRSQDGQQIIVKAIRLITAKVLSNGIVNIGPNAPLTELVKMTLVIFSEGWLKGRNIPILSLNDMADADATTATTIPYRNKTTRFNNWTSVDLAQSYLQFANGTLPVGFPYTVITEWEYIKLNAKGDIIDRPS